MALPMRVGEAEMGQVVRLIGHGDAAVDATLGEIEALVRTLLAEVHEEMMRGTRPERRLRLAGECRAYEVVLGAIRRRQEVLRQR
jgi:hypothetical protein